VPPWWTPGPDRATGAGRCRRGPARRLDVNRGQRRHQHPGPWDDVTPESSATPSTSPMSSAPGTPSWPVAPTWCQNGGGSIILTSSAAGLKGLPFLVPYVASKHAVTGMARASPPNWPRTTSGSTACTRPACGPPWAKGTHPRIDTGIEGNPRVSPMYINMLDIETTEPEDQANAVLFLASDESRYVTALAMTSTRAIHHVLRRSPMPNPGFETVAVAQKRARRRLPPSSTGPGGRVRTRVTTGDNIAAFSELGFAPHTAGFRTSGSGHLGDGPAHLVSGVHLPHRCPGRAPRGRGGVARGGPARAR